MNQELPLRDIHAAAAPPGWPPAPGWWVLAALIAVALSWLAWRGWRRLQRVRREARLLDDLERMLARTGNADDGAFLRAGADFARRLLLHAGGRRDLIGASGESFAAALIEPFADRAPLQGAARSLASDQYRRDPAVDRGAVEALLRAWIHRVVVGAAP